MSKKPDPITRPCLQCGRPFQSVPLVYEDRAIAAKLRCDACLARHEVEEIQEREQRLAAALAAAWERICPPLYRDTDRARLACSEAAQAKVLNWQYGPRGMLLHGPARLGKTRLVYLLLSRLHHIERRDIIALTASTFSHHISTRFGEGYGRGEAFVKRLSSVALLFVDDLGKGRMTDRVEAEFFHIIETRSSHLLPTLLTTNVNGSVLRNMWSSDRVEPLLGRFQEFLDQVPILPSRNVPPVVTRREGRI